MSQKIIPHVRKAEMALHKAALGHDHFYGGKIPSVGSANAISAPEVPADFTEEGGLLAKRIGVDAHDKAATSRYALAVAQNGGVRLEKKDMLDYATRSDAPPAR